MPVILPGKCFMVNSRGIQKRGKPPGGSPDRVNERGETLPGAMTGASRRTFRTAPAPLYVSV
jgi:hypothetical protein